MLTREYRTYAAIATIRKALAIRYATQAFAGGAISRGALLIHAAALGKAFAGDARIGSALFICRARLTRSVFTKP